MSESLRVDSLRPLPPSPSMNEEAVRRTSPSSSSTPPSGQEILERNAERMKRGSYSLHWMNTDKASWGKRAKPSSRGLTYTDINHVPGYGAIPEKATWLNFAPRGSVRDEYAAEMPIVDDYTLVDRDESWADNVITLYEEAKARQWNATRDIPWSELERLPDDLEKATCQLCTFLTEVEFVAGDFPAKWLYQDPAGLPRGEELPCHADDGRGAPSGGLPQARDRGRRICCTRRPASNGRSRRSIDAPTHTMGTFLLNLLGEGLVLSIFRSGEMIAKTHVDKEIFRRCLQDEARHVSYGVLELKNYLDHAPDREKALEEMHRFADVGEQVILTSFTEAALVEPVAILLGGGLDKIDQGMEGQGQLWQMSVEEYLQRCDRAGFTASRALHDSARDAPWGRN